MAPPQRRRPQLRTLSLLGGLLSLAALGAFAAGSSATTPSPPRMIVPAYFDPPGRLWTKALTAPAPTILIANPDNGPGPRAEAAYERMITHARAGGHLLIGYVYTGSAARPIASVERDIGRWAQFYDIRDIFFDEVSQSAAQLSYYRTVTDYARSHGATVTVLNPGTVPARGYFSLGAIVVTFEDTYAAYRHPGFPGWLRHVPAGEQANIVYAVPNTADARATLTAMHRHGVGVGYVTGAGQNSSNPYASLPSYYDSETDWLAR
ncbi:MAG TPA: spherulation-specific family 4 protein [Solirubrobacteraceae bacterium]|nr:spherulation-specific family 4 protein [Solirubrobacteraceae bacterium]